MRNRAFIVLMEQAVMILVFALCAAVSLNIFFLSDNISERNELKTEAAFAAQAVAEELKATKGEALNGGSWEKDENSWIKNEDSFDIEVSVTQKTAYMEQVSINVYDEEGTLFEIPVAWQEADIYE